MRLAARMQPGNPAIQHDLGHTYLLCERFSEAAAALRAAVLRKPDFAQAHWRLGLALERLEDWTGAIEAYRKAVAHIPSLADARFRLAAVLEGQGHRTEAIQHYRLAASAAARTSLGRIAEARALLAEQRDAEAEKVLRQCLALDPANALAHDMLGTVLADAGRFEEATGCYERAITLDASFSGSWYDFSRCRTHTDVDRPTIARMETALARSNLSNPQRIKVHLAIGKAYDDLADRATAMRHYDQADTVRAGILSFDRTRFAARVGALIERFSPELFAQRPRIDLDDPTPVMIVGMPRSGTTLVEQIVSCHPSVTAGGELHFWNRRGAMFEQAGASGTEREFVQTAAEDYLRLIRELAPAAEIRITDKMPFNFLWAGLIHLAFPRASIIHCQRRPIDTALSIHQTFFSPQIDFPTGGEDLVFYYREYEKLMAHWRRVLPSDRFLELRYEELIGDPHAMIRRLITFCGLPWDDACLHPERNQRIIKTASKWQARQAVHQNSVERWRHYEPWLGELRTLACPATVAPGITDQ